MSKKDVEIKKLVNKKKSSHKHGHSKRVKRDTMLAYVNKYQKSAIEKLKYLETTGIYMASEKAQYAKGQLRNLYRKFDENPDIYHSGKKFVNKLTSNADLKILYNTIKDIRAIDTRVARKHMEELEKRYQNFGVDLKERFDLFSKLSSEYREIYAFLSYGEISVGYLEGDIRNMSDIINAFYDTISDKYLTDEQVRKAANLHEKFLNNMSSKDISKLIHNGNNATTFRKLKMFGGKRGGKK